MDRIAQRLRRHLELLRPVLKLIRFVDVDSTSICRTSLGFVIAHGDLLKLAALDIDRNERQAALTRLECNRKCLDDPAKKRLGT